MYSHVHYSQDMETMQVSIHAGENEENVIIYVSMYLSITYLVSDLFIIHLLSIICVYKYMTYHLSEIYI